MDWLNKIVKKSLSAISRLTFSAGKKGLYLIHTPTCRFEDVVRAHHMHGNAVLAYLTTRQLAKVHAVAYHFNLLVAHREVPPAFRLAVMKLMIDIEGLPRFDKALAAKQYGRYLQNASTRLYPVMDSPVPKYVPVVR